MSAITNNLEVKELIETISNRVIGNKKNEEISSSELKILLEHLGAIISNDGDLSESSINFSVKEKAKAMREQFQGRFNAQQMQELNQMLSLRSDGVTLEHTDILPSNIKDRENDIASIVNVLHSFKKDIEGQETEFSEAEQKKFLAKAVLGSLRIAAKTDELDREDAIRTNLSKYLKIHKSKFSSTVFEEVLGEVQEANLKGKSYPIIRAANIGDDFMSYLPENVASTGLKLSEKETVHKLLEEHASDPENDHGIKSKFFEEVSKLDLKQKAYLRELINEAQELNEFNFENIGKFISSTIPSLALTGGLGYLFGSTFLGLALGLTLELVGGASEINIKEVDLKKPPPHQKAKAEENTQLAG